MRETMSTIAAIILVGVLAAGYYAGEENERLAACSTDTECMMMHGGDGGPAPLDDCRCVQDCFE